MATTKRLRATKSNKAAKVQSIDSVSDVAKVTTQTVDIQEAIRSRAYDLFLQRGGQHGHHFEDWLRAESEVLAHFGARSA